MSVVEIETALLQGRLAVVFESGEATIMEINQIPSGTGSSAQMPLSAGDRPRARAELAALLNSPGGRDLIESLLHTAHKKGRDQAIREVMSERHTGGVTMC